MNYKRGDFLCSQCIDIFHISGTLKGIGLRTEVVDVVHDDSFLGAGYNRTSEFAIAMMRQNTMHDALRLLLVEAFAVKDVLQPMSPDVDMAKQVHVGLRLALLVVFVHLPAVVEKDGQNAMLHLNLIGQTGIESFEHVEHLVGMVEQTTWVGMVHTGGCGIEAEGFEKPTGELLYDGHQCFVATVAKQLLDSIVPDIAANGTRQQVVERMVQQRLTAGLEVAEVARLLAVVVLDVVKDDKSAHLWLCCWRHVPNGHVDGLREVCHLERRVWRTCLRHAVAPADYEVFFIIHLTNYYLVIYHLQFDFRFLMAFRFAKLSFFHNFAHINREKRNSKAIKW